MENASKALLIAAAVLIVILLIAFGMKLLGSSDNTAEQAEKVGQSITSESVIATEKALDALKGTDAAAGALSEAVTFKIKYQEEFKEFTVDKGTTWREWANKYDAITYTGLIEMRRVITGPGRYYNIYYVSTVDNSFNANGAVELDSVISAGTYYTGLYIEG